MKQRETTTATPPNLPNPAAAQACTKINLKLIVIFNQSTIKITINCSLISEKIKLKIIYK